MILAAVMIPVLLNMSGLGGDDDKKIDVPAAPEIWAATVTDSTLTETALDEFSVDGSAFLTGGYGAGTLAIKFGDIAKIDFEPGEKGKVLALVSLKQGGSIKKLSLDAKTPIYGKTGFGNYKLLAKEAKRVVFTSGPIKRSEKTSARTVTPPKSTP